MRHEGCTHTYILVFNAQKNNPHHTQKSRNKTRKRIPQTQSHTKVHRENKKTTLHLRKTARTCPFPADAATLVTITFYYTEKKATLRLRTTARTCPFSADAASVVPVKFQPTLQKATEPARRSPVSVLCSASLGCCVAPLPCAWCV